ncbi:MAG TPA: ATP-binding protein [Methanothrix sp.]|nr:ATP-binding protein [Methanothrix sp.]
MKIVLKDDWDIPIGSPNIARKKITLTEGCTHEKGLANSSNTIKEYEGYYGGRKNELEKLTNELYRRSTGSILVSGYRGVGKTSLVYKALSDLRKKDKELIIVILNAAQLDVRSDNEEVDPKKIIENLIRRLYLIANETDLEIDIKNEIDLLYQRAIASVVSIENSCLSQREQINEKTHESNLSLTITNNSLILIFFSGLFALFFQYINIMSVEFLNKIFPIIIASAGSLYIVYKNTQVTIKTKSINESANEIYMFDNCIANLEFDLERIHKLLYYNYNKKVIYVIDELDKLESDNKKSKKVEDILNYFKNFFTLSNAIFVFIGGEKLYDSLLMQNGPIKPNEEISRPINYTYFTSKYFISRPCWSDLNSYFDDIIESTDLDPERLNTIKRALCFEAKNDFFDLKKFISSRVTSIGSTERPIIELIESEEDINKARFHKAITILYEDKYKSKRSVDWRVNEKLINKLYQHVYYILENSAEDQIEDLEDDTLVSQLMRDFNSFLEFLGAFKVVQEKQKKIKGLNVPIRTYRYIGKIPTEPPSLLSEATEFERRFVHKFDLFMSYAEAMIFSFMVAKGINENDISKMISNTQNLLKEFSKLDYDIQRIYEPHRRIYDAIDTKGELYVYQREDIEKRTKDIENHTENLLNSLPRILSKMITLLNPKIKLNVISNKVDDKIFNIIPAEFRDHFLGGQVIIDLDSSRQILIIYGRKHYIKSIEPELMANASTHRVAYITKIQEKDLDNTYTISRNNPKKLKDSMISFLIGAKKFLHNSQKIES